MGPPAPLGFKAKDTSWQWSIQETVELSPCRSIYRFLYVCVKMLFRHAASRCFILRFEGSASHASCEYTWSWFEHAEGLEHVIEHATFNNTIEQPGAWSSGPCPMMCHDVPWPYWPSTQRVPQVKRLSSLSLTTKSWEIPVSAPDHCHRLLRCPRQNLICWCTKAWSETTMKQSAKQWKLLCTWQDA